MKEDNSKPVESNCVRLPPVIQTPANLPYFYIVDIIRKQSKTLDDFSTVKPLFLDFDAIEKNPNSIFPYQMLVFPGNHSETVYRISRPRGFKKVTKFVYINRPKTMKKKTQIKLISFGNQLNYLQG